MVTRIQDPHLFTQAQDRLRPICDGPYDLSASLIRQNGWQVGIVEGAGYLTSDSARMFAAAAASLACLEIEVIPTRNLNPPVFFIRCRAEPHDLLDLRVAYPLSLILLPSSLQFVALLNADYHLYAGPNHFVELAIGDTPKAAYERMFAEFCAPGVPSAIRNFYVGIARYREFTDPGNGQNVSH